MPVGAAIGGAAVVGAGSSIYSANKAGKAQSKAAKSAAGQERAMFDAQRRTNAQLYSEGKGNVNENYKSAAAFLQPYDNYGPMANDQMARLSGLRGSEQQRNALANDPGYQFRLSQGVNALDRSAAARGMLQSGAQRQALTSYGQGLASEELNNAYNRVAGVQSNAQQAAGALSSLYGQRGNALANLSQGQATQSQNLSMNTSNALGNYAMSAGQGRASAAEGIGSGINAGLQNGLTAYMMQQQMQRPQTMYTNNYGMIGGRPYNGPR